MFKKAISALLAALFVASLFGGVTVSASQGVYANYLDDASYDETLGISREDYETFRARLFESAANFEESCYVYDFRIDYTSDIGVLINELIRNGNPELFHVAGASFSISSGDLYSVNFNYSCAKTEYEDRLAAFKNAAESLLDGVEGSDLTDLQKALIIHDRLAVLCEYDIENYNSGTYYNDDYTAYGALVECVTMCEGYSKAYGYLLNRVGIESYLASSVELGHMWNIVYLDGEKYHVDVTWDDANPNKVGAVAHDYFMCSSAKFNQGAHEADDYDMTPVSEKYDASAPWELCEAETVICGGDVYIISGGVLYKWDGVNAEEVARFPAVWLAPTGYYAGYYQRLATDGNYLYVSLPSKIVRYYPPTGEKVTVYEQAKRDIYGMTYRDGIFYIDPYTSPNFNYDTHKLYGITFPYTAVPPQVYEPGDVNGDGDVNVKDVLIVRRVIAGLAEIGEEEYARADMNGDGDVTSKDVLKMRRYIAGLD